MAKIAKFQLEDGRVGRFEVPDDATQEEVEAYAEEQQQKADAFMASIEEQQPPPEPGFGERLGRSVGLAGRAAVEGAGELAGIVTNPITYAANQIPGVNLDTTAELATRGADYAGLPSPENTSERLSSQAMKWVVPAGAVARGANAVAKGGSQLASTIARAPGPSMTRWEAFAKGSNQLAETLARAPGSQMTGAAAGGVSSEYVRETGGGPVAQLAAGLGGGFGGAAMPALAQKLGNGVMAVVNSLRGTQTDIRQINLALEQILATNGITLDELGGSIRANLVEEMQVAISQGREINPDIVRRLADHALVGTTPIRSTVTLDPAHITQEKNLAKIGANSTDDNLMRLHQIQNENDKVLTRNLNEMGAGTERTAYDAGQRVKEGLRTVDDTRPMTGPPSPGPSKQVVDRAYRAVRAADGRYAGINTRAFSTAANDALDQNQLGYVLPAEARAWLNNVSDGTIPLNVNVMEQSDSMLSGLQRTANRKGESQQALAIQHVRNALWEAPIDTAAGERAAQQYHLARRLARERFRLIEENPAMRAALDDADPDKFMNTYVLGTGNDASVRNVRALARDLRVVPEAFQAARENILYYIKGKAMGANADETSNFSAAGYNRVIKSIGLEKLQAFFSPAEVRRLRAVGRVAGYEKYQPVGSAVNNSNTTAALTGFIERTVSSTAARHIPILRYFASGAESMAQSQRHRVGAGEALNPSILKPQEAQAMMPNIAPLAVPMAIDQANQ